MKGVDELSPYPAVVECSVVTLCCHQDETLQQEMPGYGSANCLPSLLKPCHEQQRDGGDVHGVVGGCGVDLKGY